MLQCMLKALMSVYSVTTNTLGSITVMSTVGIVMGTCLGVIFSSDLNETSQRVEEKHFNILCVRGKMYHVFFLSLK